MVSPTLANDRHFYSSCLPPFFISLQFIDLAYNVLLHMAREKALKGLKDEQDARDADFAGTDTLFAADAFVVGKKTMAALSVTLVSGGDELPEGAEWALKVDAADAKGRTYAAVFGDGELGLALGCLGVATRSDGSGAGATPLDEVAAVLASNVKSVARTFAICVAPSICFTGAFDIGKKHLEITATARPQRDGGEGAWISIQGRNTANDRVYSASFQEAELVHALGIEPGSDAKAAVEALLPRLKTVASTLALR